MPGTILNTGTTGLIGFQKTQQVLLNPAVRKLQPGERLSLAIVLDFTVDGGFESALEGVTHIIHAGSPVPEVPEGYAMDKIVELHNPDEFIKMQNPHFTLSHVGPTFVFGERRSACVAAIKTAYSVGLHVNDKRVRYGTWKELFGKAGET
ncbi:Uu.00g057570.m01.CDS01 [Anthostomella pinea]|uniref:Uu.00g057570.m01.CDS01 n=1 Tax=Anthostomella pinea TaxID=933095 RepID=A0AAI8YM55_9PEZI|nr:Uu.00g057570.m01.CDS01 [Anthostomella pinea]